MEIEYTPRGQMYRGAAAAFRVIVFAVVAVTILIVARIVFLFFGQLKEASGYLFVRDITDSVLWAFEDLGVVKTPFEGVFDIGATILLLILIFTEFILTGIARFFSRQARHEIINPEKPAPQVQVVISPTIGGNVAQTQPAANASASGEDAAREEEIAGDKTESVKIPETP